MNRRFPTPKLVAVALVAILAAVTGHVLAARLSPLQLPNTLVAGEAAKAGDVNENFTALVDRINALEQRIEDEVKVPVGTILAWHRDLPGTSRLPEGWEECDGQLVRDRESPLYSQRLPDLNSQVYAGGRGRYLRGGRESGRLNESTYWTDNGASYSSGGPNGRYFGAPYARIGDLDATTPLQNTYIDAPTRLASARRFQTAAMSVVWIIRVK